MFLPGLWWPAFQHGLWPEPTKNEGIVFMEAKRILVTGGAGLVGSHILDQLLNRGTPEIIVLDNFVRGKEANIRAAVSRGNVRVVRGDICDSKLVHELMAGIDLVFHQAAIRITQCAEQPRLALEVMVDGTFNVLEAAVKAGVKKVVAASSASIYGLAEAFPTPETHHPYHNDTFYGASKVFNEGMLKSFRSMYGLNYVALRYFNVYGPRMDVFGVYTEVLVRWAEKIARGEPPLILGDGKQTMDFVYVEDVARANLLAADSNAVSEVFNIASGHETSLNDLAETLLKVMGSDLKPVYGPARSVNPVSRRLACTKRAREKIGFEAKVSLEEGLRRFIDWWKQTKNR
jgi:UDP-glucose 4-epimerase